MQVVVSVVSLVADGVGAGLHLHGREVAGAVDLVEDVDPVFGDADAAGVGSDNHCVAGSQRVDQADERAVLDDLGVGDRAVRRDGDGGVGGHVAVIYFGRSLF